MKNNTKKTDIIAAYATVIEKQGIEGASLSAVANHLGINQSLIFHYFENKEDLTCQLASHVAELALASYSNAWKSNTTINDATFEYFVEYILEIHHNRRKIMSPKLYYALTYLMPRQKTVQDIFAGLTQSLVEIISSKIQMFVDEGIIKCDDIEMSARTLLCLADGILCYNEITPKEKRRDFINAQKILFCNSVGYSINS